MCYHISMKNIRDKKNTLLVILSFVFAVLLFLIGAFCIVSFPLPDEINDKLISDNITIAQIKESYHESFSDEFDGDSLNTSYWNFEGSKVNRNDELQSYADNMADENVEIENGVLNIIAKKEKRNGKEYTSASLTTQGKVAFRYGIFEMRAKLPQGVGLWPAFWLMGQTDVFNIQMWPVTGEIDIMESICGKDDERTVYSTIHYGGNLVEGSKYRQNGEYSLTATRFCDDFHTFGVVLTDRQMLFYVDDVIHTRMDISSELCDTFRRYDKYILINLAIGGEWAGAPNDETVFPNTYSIDYVKIYQPNTSV